MTARRVFETSWQATTKKVRALVPRLPRGAGVIVFVFADDLRNRADFRKVNRFCQASKNDRIRGSSAAADRTPPAGAAQSVFADLRCLANQITQLVFINVQTQIYALEDGSRIWVEGEVDIHFHLFAGSHRSWRKGHVSLRPVSLRTVGSSVQNDTWGQFHLEPYAEAV